MNLYLKIGITAFIFVFLSLIVGASTIFNDRWQKISKAGFYISIGVLLLTLLSWVWSQ